METTAYLISAKEEGISPEELFDIVSFIADNPNAGDLMQGTGGARKVRFPTKHKGKSGGYRIITFFGGKDIPVFLLDVYSKSSQGNLTKAERNELKWILTALLDEYRKEK
ncbi:MULTISPECIES: type II toxin-antitoxin system RelE/ParE family toxin [unclassified Bartonella]|uniref:type II toxin-antitoxin system RelE/ParE family toxin n=1 Tax=unclassified Bartonella TaxID=2645622 RepID=UPI0035CFF9AC